MRIEEPEDGSRLLHVGLGVSHQLPEQRRQRVIHTVSCYNSNHLKKCISIFSFSHNWRLRFYYYCDVSSTDTYALFSLYITNYGVSEPLRAGLCGWSLSRSHHFRPTPTLSSTFKRLKFHTNCRNCPVRKLSFISFFLRKNNI